MRTPRSPSFWLLIALSGLLGAACSVDQRSPSVVQAPLTPEPLGSSNLGSNVAAPPVTAPADAGGGGPTADRPSPGDLIVTQREDPIAPVPLSLGQVCSPSSLACAGSLRCVDGSCRLPCVTSVDCAALGDAVDCTVGAALDGSGVGACNYQLYCDPAHPQQPRPGAQACPAGSGCRPSESGASECQPQPGGATLGNACVSDLNCAPGYFCGGSGTCRRHCLDDGDCPGEVCSAFAPARRAGDLAVGFCASPACDPVHPQAPRDGLSSCPVGSGCSSVAVGETSRCSARNASGSARYGECSVAADCQPGLFCGAGDVSGFCGQYCFSDADCGGGRCRLFTPPSLAGTEPVGSCVELCNPVRPQSSEGGFGACPDGFSCVLPTDGNSVCLRAGPLRRYDRCSGQQCAAGLACGEGMFAYCVQLCLNDEDCAGGRCRAGTLRAGATPVGTCAEVCDPTDPGANAGPFTACPRGFGCTGDLNGASTCVLNGSGRFGAPCGGGEVCASGFACDQSQGQCAKFCFDDADCEGRRCSIALNPPQFADTRALRFCEEP
jgi:hypothetical protein